MILQHANAVAEERAGGQANLFGTDAAGAERPFQLNHVELWSSAETLRHERESIGFYLSSHPMEAYSGVLAAKRVTPADQIVERVKQGATSLLLAGTVDRKQERRSIRGNRFAYVTLSDTTNQVEVMVFSEKLAEARDLLEPGKAVMITADVRQDNDAVRLSAARIESLDDVAARHSTSLEVAVIDAGPVAELKRILEQGNGGRATVWIVIRSPAQGREVQIVLPGGFAVTPTIREELARTEGVLGIRET